MRFIKLFCNFLNKKFDFQLHPNTVSTRYLLVVTLAGPFFVIFGSYFLEYCNGKNLFSTEMYSRIFKVTFFVYLDYVIAFGIVTVALEFIKCATGRLRPNFLNMCRPNLTICENDPEAFIEEYECDPILTKYGRNSKMSFPSGHAAAAVFAQLFIWYFLKSAVLNGNFKEHNLTLMRKFKRYVIIFYSFFAVICAMTRIFDCWHFPSDVLGGVLTALVFFYATLWKYTKFPKKKKNEEQFSKKE